MDHTKVTEGRIVTLYPGEYWKKNFKNKKKDSYPAIVTEVNDNSIDVTVFGVGEVVFIARLVHVSDAKPEGSYWDWPKKVE